MEQTKLEDYLPLILDEIRQLRQELQELKDPMPEWVDINGVAKLMSRKDKQHLRKQIVSGNLPIKYRQVRGRYRFNTASIQKYLQQHSN